MSTNDSINHRPNANSPIVNNDRLNSSIEKLVNINNMQLVVVGDFNFPELDWESCTSRSGPNHKASKFMRSCRDAFLTQHVTEYTHFSPGNNPSVIDLLLTDITTTINHIQIDEPLGKSHHGVIVAEIAASVASTMNNRISFQYNKGNYIAMASDLDID